MSLRHELLTILRNCQLEHDKYCNTEYYVYCVDKHNYA